MQNITWTIIIIMICQMFIVQAHWSIPSHMTICNQAYFLPKTILTRQYYSILSSIMVLLLWSYWTIVMSYWTIVWLDVWQKCHSGATMGSDITIWHHNSSTMPQTVEHGMLVNYKGESSNICIHRPMCLNHKPSASPQSILLPQIHKTPYCPHHRSIFVYYWPECFHNRSRIWVLKKAMIIKIYQSNECHHVLVQTYWSWWYY